MLEMLQTFATALAIACGISLAVILIGMVVQLKKRLERKAD